MSVRDAVRKKRPAVVKVDDVFIRGLSGAGRAKFMALQAASKDAGGVKPEVIAAMALCEEDGTPAYDPDKAEDIAELAACDGDFLSRIAIKLFEVSGLQANAVEDAAKNSGASPNGASGSSSLHTSSTAP